MEAAFAAAALPLSLGGLAAAVFRIRPTWLGLGLGLGLGFGFGLGLALGLAKTSVRVELRLEA